MCTLTIIIPHKNTPALLQRCLDSIPVDKEVEVIVVDDKSDPEKVDFLNFPGINDSRVQIIFSNEGLGAGYARNLGLQKATGQWILFADSDDFFEPGAFEHFYRHKKDTAEIVYFGVSSKYSDSLLEADRADYFQKLLNGYVAGDEETEYWLRLRYLVPWGKMIRKELIQRENIRFDEIPASNDIMFSLRTGYEAKSITVDQAVVYCVTVGKGSLTNTRSKEIARCRYKVKLRYNEFVRAVEKDKYQYTVRREVFEARQYGWAEVFLYLQLAIRYKTNLFFNLSLSRSLKSMKVYEEEEKKKDEYIIRK